ncbi:MAG TPA: NAD-dependent succinate-semialdehyde dehydrogenase [Caulobacteraceae bacterium]|nr:NAD-dependent succinate-semialdehyde dehydrogenase [Caulobacteraceae bacterium]
MNDVGKPIFQLSDPALLKDRAFIDGAWSEAAAGRRFAVTNPATAETIVEIADCERADAVRAVEAAAKALPQWRARTAKDRAAVMRRWRDLMMENQEDLARLMTAEQGKPLAETRGEVAYGASFIEWFAEEAKRVYGDVIPTFKAGSRIIVIKQPTGVVTAITPWNFPNAMITRKAAPALAAGCTFVVKPAQETPLSALAIAELAERAGVPAGVFNVVPSRRARELGAELTSNPKVAKFSFTGSTEVGRLLMAQCATTVKKVSLELGGNAPFIVFDDAALAAAAEGAMASKYRNMGQTCVCANRFLVQAGVHDAFAAELKKRAAAMKVGNGLEAGVAQGPLINAAAVDKVERLIAEAEAKGAKVELGGHRHALGGSYFEPTVITGVTPDMAIAREEIFGPVATLTRFETEADAVRLANDTEFGLAAYFYARDLGRVFRVAEALEYGMVAVNDGILSTEVAPFGGVKQSGLGREGSKYGIDEYLEIKYVLLSGLGA